MNICNLYNTRGIIDLPGNSLNAHWDVKGELILSRPLKNKKDLLSSYNKLNHDLKVIFPKNPTSRDDLKRELWNIKENQINSIVNSEQYGPILDEIELNDRFDKIETINSKELFILSNDRIKLFSEIDERRKHCTNAYFSYWVESGGRNTSVYWKYLSDFKKSMKSIGVELSGELIITISYIKINKKNDKIEAIRSKAQDLIKEADFATSLFLNWIEKFKELLKELDPQIITSFVEKYKVNIQDEELKFIKISKEELNEDIIPKT